MIEKYFAKNVETGEEVEILAHSAGDTFASPEIPDTAFGFVKASLKDEGEEAWKNAQLEDFIWFENMNHDGQFTKPESAQLDITGKFDFISKEVEDTENLG